MKRKLSCARRRGGGEGEKRGGGDLFQRYYESLSALVLHILGVRKKQKVIVVLVKMNLYK